MFDRTVNAKFKPTASNAGPGNNPGRRNSMLTPARGVSVAGTGGNIRKLTKVNSLTSNHHFAVCYPPSNIYQNSNNAGSNSALQRTTSESLRLNSLSRVGPPTATSVSRASSNSSLATSNSTSLAPKSSSSSGGSNSTPQQQPVGSSNTSSSSSNNSFTKASSPNNNGARTVSGGTATAATATGSHHQQPHHHHHHHHHHQHHNHHQQQQQQTSLSQGHASLTVAGVSAAGGGGGGGGSSATAGGATNRKPKTTSSFEITSVTVGHPKLNAAGDTGDESADDLDESHTDDNSRITDLENETPSMSEDTFSKEEVYYANNALSTNAPVIPTSSQYGLVVVDPIGPSLGQTIQNVQVNVSDNIINVVSGAVTPGGTKKKDDNKETQHRSERFKVVKIESTEPFKRGRWMCMDYLDHSSVGNGGNNNEKTGSSTSDAHAATADGAAGVVGGSEALPHKTTQSMILPPTQKLNENHLEANSTDANWNYAEQQQQHQQQSQQASQQSQQQSSQQQQQQTQISATPSGVMTAPATVVHGMHQLHMEAQQQQQQLFDSVNANASSPNPPGDPNNMDYARTAAMQLQQTLQQLKQREDAMDVPPGGYPNYQNGGDVAGGAANNNNSGGGAGESQLSTSYVEQQQPLSPAPLTPQAAPTFAAVAAGQSPNFQLEQQQQQQATSQIDGIVSQPFNQQQQQQQQQTPQQSTPQQTAATATSVVAAAPPQQTSNTSNAAVTTGQGQTLPLLLHMNSYDKQPNLGAAATGAAAATSVAAPPAIPTLQLQSAPSTIADPQQLMVPQLQQQEEQQQQQQTQQQQIPTANIASASANNSNLNLTNTNVVATAEATTNTLTLTDEQATAAANTAAAVAVATGAAAATGVTSSSATTQQQIQQQPNAESETESLRTTSIPGGNRKRAFSNPHIGGPNDPTFMHRLNPQLYYYNKSQSGRSSFCVDESLWPTNNPNGTVSDTNLYMGSSTDEDYEEAIDQFSPTMYTRNAASRAIPIPSSAGNSPQHQMHHSQPRFAAAAGGMNHFLAGGGGGAGPSTAGAFSASPSIYAYPHSPFYASSPETSLSSPVQTSGLPGHHPNVSSRISFSYDPAFQRLQVPIIAGDRRPRSPLECATVFAAVAAAATCGGAVVGGAADTMINSASGTSAVAIDNKIEQAMDLVKSHLMIAVREEVEVLKERISELMEKINKLELENNILKSNIPQETLQQLQMQLQIAAPPATPAIQAAPAATTAAGQAVQGGQQQTAGTVAVTGLATSPASAVVPTSIPNGSAENGGSAVESVVVSVEQQQQQQQVTSAAATAVTTTNGPMS
ncbi:LOW QUALITY PROTEIN: protein bunched, class 2/F/G isoform [Drosophila eugracilis]|uniref:LOW QUALITY PROTEIN: protein bunched, class 2/F/G isoform n=1 Tax=Drosophila eugracilis TaxID=29029 RepID=UPI001BDB0A78|nr:LOW QUALITY PROTEIN: protein bunched, class 2/F/G isoform [Drosophila eugracilis]